MVAGLVQLLLAIIYLAVIVFVLVMIYRLVRATEKIAAKLENGITVNKEDTDTNI